MIFLSYASQDRERARAVATALHGKDIPVWWDRDLSIGQRFEQIIRDKLSEATCVVVLWSRHAVESDWVKDEANEGRRRQILVPALLDDVPIPYGFGQIHTANLTHWTGSPDDQEFVALLAAVKQLFKMHAQFPRAATASRQPIRVAARGADETARFPAKDAKSHRRYRPSKWLLPFIGSLALSGVALSVFVFERRTEVPRSAFTQPLPFNTGWIYTGVYDTPGGIYLEGPYAIVSYRPGTGERGAIVPRIGDVLQVVKDRRVIIANFKSAGLKHQLISPPLVHNRLTDVDETGEILKKSTLVIVRDVEISSDPGRSDTIWCRIAVCDRDTDGCMKAVAELGR
jgi:hypothetical protein